MLPPTLLLFNLLILVVNAQDNVRVNVAPCDWYEPGPIPTARPLENYLEHHYGTTTRCLEIDKPFNLAFVAGNCYRNIGQGLELATSCFDLSQTITQAGSTHLFPWVRYRPTIEGIALETNGLADYNGWNYTNAPPASCTSAAPTLDTCAAIAAHGMCAHLELENLCPSSCASSTAPDTALLTPAQAENARILYAKTYLVIRIRSGHQFLLNSDASLTRVWSGLDAASQYTTTLGGAHGAECASYVPPAPPAPPPYVAPPAAPPFSPGGGSPAPPPPAAPPSPSPPPSPPNAIADCVLDMVRRDESGSFVWEADGNLKAEYEIISALARAIHAAGTNDEYACRLPDADGIAAAASLLAAGGPASHIAPHPKLHCMDIGAATTLSGLPRLVPDAIDATTAADVSAALLNATASGGVDLANLADGGVNLFGMSQKCGGDYRGDGTINGYDTAVLLWSQFQRDPYNHSVPLREVQTVEAVGESANICCALHGADARYAWACPGGTPLTRLGYMTNVFDSPCEHVNLTATGSSRRRRRRLDEGRRRLQDADADVDAAPSIQVERWATVLGSGEWMRVKLPTTALALELVLLNVGQESAFTDLAFKSPPSRYCSTAGPVCEPDPFMRSNVVIGFHRDDEAIRAAGLSPSDCALVVPANEVVLDVGGVVSIFQEPPSRACPFDMYVWVPEGMSFDSDGPCGGALGIDFGSSLNDGRDGYIQRTVACPGEELMLSPLPPPAPPAPPPPPPPPVQVVRVQTLVRETTYDAAAFVERIAAHLAVDASDVDVVVTPRAVDDNVAVDVSVRAETADASYRIFSAVAALTPAAASDLLGMAVSFIADPYITTELGGGGDGLPSSPPPPQPDDLTAAGIIAAGGTSAFLVPAAIVGGGALLLTILVTATALYSRRRGAAAATAKKVAPAPTPVFELAGPGPPKSGGSDAWGWSEGDDDTASSVAGSTMSSKARARAARAAELRDASGHASAWGWGDGSAGSGGAPRAPRSYFSAMLGANVDGESAWGEAEDYGAALASGRPPASVAASDAASAYVDADDYELAVRLAKAGTAAAARPQGDASSAYEEAELLERSTDTRSTVFVAAGEHEAALRLGSAPKRADAYLDADEYELAARGGPGAASVEETSSEPRRAGRSRRDKASPPPSSGGWDDADGYQGLDSAAAASFEKASSEPRRAGRSRRDKASPPPSSGGWDDADGYQGLDTSAPRRGGGGGEALPSAAAADSYGGWS